MRARDRSPHLLDRLALVHRSRERRSPRAATRRRCANAPAARWRQRGGAGPGARRRSRALAARHGARSSRARGGAAPRLGARRSARLSPDRRARARRCEPALRARAAARTRRSSRRAAGAPAPATAARHARRLRAAPRRPRALTRRSPGARRASQGQHRDPHARPQGWPSWRAIERRAGRHPILLLDDVSSELDPTRIGRRSSTFLRDEPEPGLRHDDPPELIPTPRRRARRAARFPRSSGSMPCESLLTGLKERPVVSGASERLKNRVIIRQFRACPDLLEEAARGLYSAGRPRARPARYSGRGALARTR